MFSCTGQVDVHAGYAQYEHVVITVLFEGRLVLDQSKPVLVGQMTVVGKNSHLVGIHRILKQIDKGISDLHNIVKERTNF